MPKAQLPLSGSRADDPIFTYEKSGDDESHPARYRVRRDDKAHPTDDDEETGGDKVVEHKVTDLEELEEIPIN